MARQNPGIAHLAKKVHLCRETDVKNVVGFAKEAGAEYAFIGPEAPLEAGIVDALESAGIPCIGPTKAAARLETDKAFCRQMMDHEPPRRLPDVPGIPFSCRCGSFH